MYRRANSPFTLRKIHSHRDAKSLKLKEKLTVY